MENGSFHMASNPSIIE